MSLFGSYPQLLDLGSYGADVAVGVDLLTADLPGGYDRALLIGPTDGTREWTLKFDDLTQTDEFIQNQSQADWLWDFYLAVQANGGQSFVVQCPKDDKFYLASFAEPRLSYNLFALKLFSTGIRFKQRREKLWTRIKRATHWYEVASLAAGDGEKIASLPDWAGVYPVGQATEAQQPVMGLNPGELPGLIFTGAETLAGTTPAGSSGFYVFCVGYASANGSLFEWGASSNGTGISLYAENGNRLVARCLASGTPHFITVEPHSFGVPHLYTIQTGVGANAFKLWIDGTLAGQANVSGTLATMTRLVVGGDGGGGQRLTGGISALGIVPAASLTTGDRQLIETALMAGYGL